jgi:DNA ligase-1
MLAKLIKPDVHLKGLWLSEPKYDGERMIAIANNKKISLWTKRHVQATKKFPELISDLEKNVYGNNWMLDGEVTVPGGFRNLLKRNVENKTKISILSKKIPATYHLFDIIFWEKNDLTKKPLLQRKKILLEKVNSGAHLQIVPFQEAMDVKEQFKDHIKKGFEGTILKKGSSIYEPGQRSGQWLKIKMGDTIDVNVVGATKSSSSLPFGALILEKDGKFFGKVGTGFSDQERSSILEILKEKEAPLNIDLPQDVSSEVLITNKPLLAEVHIQEMIRKSPRAPVWVRFRWDD